MTALPFHRGDLVLLAGKGCSRPAAELMAIWTVTEIRGDQATVRFDPDYQTVEGLPSLGQRRFPVSWLVLYRHAASGDDGEDEDF